ncbi:hypothetical protein GCM10010187_06710 [Actinomadura coerulea]|nr:hypothetical protein GCM10010187_06710 [Actinomadura coerulea]
MKRGRITGCPSEMGTPTDPDNFSHTFSKLPSARDPVTGIRTSYRRQAEPEIDAEVTEQQSDGFGGQACRFHGFTVSLWLSAEGSGASLTPIEGVDAAGALLVSSDHVGDRRGQRGRVERVEVR